MRFEVFHGPADVFEQCVGGIEAEAVPNQHAHDRHVGDVGDHRVRCNLPSARAQPVGEIEKRILAHGVFAHRPGYGRDSVAAVAVEEQFERSKLGDPDERSVARRRNSVS